MNPARPAPGTVLCALDEIDKARGFRFREGEALFFGFVLRDGERVWGFIDACPHTGQPLSMFGDRYLTRDGEHLLCTGHGAMFRPADGVCIAGPCEGRSLAKWPVEVREGEVVVVA
ncbi:MAG TPA: Rieske 2Fe-2S domain-containing protein [Caulobacteraceae bacterium]